MMNSWLILTALLATTALAQDVIPVPTCRSQHVHYNRTTENSCVVSCNDVPIENFCIPAQANSMENLIIDLTACDTQWMDWIPTGLFQEDNQIRRLSVYAPSSYTRFIQSLKRDTFKNLKGLEELTLEGFERIRYLDPDVFLPLVNLKKLRLIGFGGQLLTYRQLGDALLGLSSSLLAEITMDTIHTGVNQEKTLDVNNLFRISGVTITSLVLINNDFYVVMGTLPSTLPSLRYFECSVFFLTYAATAFGLDSIFFLQHLEEINYSIISDSGRPGTIFRRSADDIKDALSQRILEYYYSFKSDPKCFYGKLCRFGPKLKRF